MVARGEDGGCVTEQTPCPIPKASAAVPVTQLENSNDCTLVEIDYYSQARKVLSERSPFDVLEEASTSSVPTLPSGLVSLLNRHPDSRRRHKKSHSSADKKKSRAGERSCGASSIWVETEDYFRDLTLPDIDNLFDASSVFNLATWKCVSIPSPGNAPRFNVGGSEDKEEHDEKVDRVVVKNEDGFMEIDGAAVEVLAQDIRIMIEVLLFLFLIG